MGDMGGMQMPQQPSGDGGIDAELRSHMQMMRGASGDSLMAMVPAHRQMAANMLARMNREMSEMNMPTTPVWTATIDSLRSDLTRMPEMASGELEGFLPAHESRLNRLAETHRQMMRDMGM